MEVIIIDRALNREEARLIIKTLHRINGDGVEMYSNVELPEMLKDYSHGKIELSAGEKKRVNYDIFRKILNFGEREIDGKKITDRLCVGKASLWHYHKFRIYFLVRNLYFKVELLRNLSETYDKVVYFGDMAEQHVASNVEVHPQAGDRNSRRVSFTVMFKYGLFVLMRLFISVFGGMHAKRKKHLLIDSSLKQRIIDISTLKQSTGNYYLEYLFEKADKEFIVLDDYSVPKFSDRSFKFNFRALRKRKDGFFGEQVFFKGLLSREVRTKLKRSSSYILGQYNIIKGELQDSIDLMIMAYLMSFHKTSKLYLFKYFSYQRFFQRYKFSTITSVDENSPKIKTILDAGKSTNVITIGMQHGTIHELHPAYMFTVEDRKRKIMPDYTLVWGMYWKELLEAKGNYDPRSLIVTGQLRTDIIPKLTESAIELQEVNTEGREIILYASQFQRDPGLRRKAAYDIFKSVKDHPDWLLIVKLHPSEVDEFGYYHSIAKQAGCTNYKIVYWEDLYLLLSRSDVVTTCFSTVGSEAVYFGKPLIIIDHLKQDIQNYYRNGVAFRATDSDELENLIQRIIDGKLKIEPQAYHRFISKYAYKIDGNAAERIIDFIKSRNQVSIFQ